MTWFRNVSPPRRRRHQKFWCPSVGRRLTCPSFASCLHHASKHLQTADSVATSRIFRPYLCELGYGVVGIEAMALHCIETYNLNARSHAITMALKTCKGVQRGILEFKAEHQIRVPDSNMISETVKVLNHQMLCSPDQKIRVSIL